MYTIDNSHLSLSRIEEIMEKHEELVLGEEAVRAIEKCRAYLDRKMEDIGRPIYGVTTGFGSLCNVSIPEDKLSRLQHNLVMSHACGAGEKSCNSFGSITMRDGRCPGRTTRPLRVACDA